MRIRLRIVTKWLQLRSQMKIGMQNPCREALGEIERNIVDIELKMTSQIARVNQFGAELSAAQAILKSMKVLLVELDSDRMAVLERQSLQVALAERAIWDGPILRDRAAKMPHLKAFASTAPASSGAHIRSHPRTDKRRTLYQSPVLRFYSIWCDIGYGP